MSFTQQNHPLVTLPDVLSALERLLQGLSQDSGRFYSIIFGLSTLALASPSQAAPINFSSWNQFGDVSSPAIGQANFSTNALQNDDFPAPDSNFNLSTFPAVDSSILESSLGLVPQSLDPDPLNFVTAFEGSGLQQQYTFSQETTFSFNWTFLTNDLTHNLGGLNFDDYAFIALDNQVQTLASTNSSISILIPSSTNFSREVSGTYQKIFSPGIYKIALGVVDIGDYNNTSALKIGNAQVTAVPEPLNILGAVTALGFGVFLKRKLKNSNSKLG